MSLNNIKTFLSELNWNGIRGTNSPIFTRHEIKSVPLKWLKHLFMVRIGLRDFQELTNEIKRFSMTERGILMASQMCINLLSQEIREGESLIIVKIVFPEVTMGLPNYRIKYTNQVNEVFSEIRQKFLLTSTELWICLSNINHHNINFGGRIALGLDKEYKPDILEIVWYTSPRVLDGYQVSEYPYLKASKIPSSLNFRLDHTQMPHKYNDDGQLEYRMIRDYKYTLFELYKRQEKINNMCEVLYANDVREVVLQFKVNQGNFKMIDWDTNIEADITLRHNKKK